MRLFYNFRILSLSLYDYLEEQNLLNDKFLLLFLLLNHLKFELNIVQLTKY